VWPKVAQARTESMDWQGLESTNSVLLPRFSRTERVTGIEPALSAWESDTDPPSTLRGPI